MRFLKSLLAALVVALGIPVAAFAGTTGDPEIPTIGAKGVIAETGDAGGAGLSFVGVVVIFESDDTAAYGGPTGATLDTGTEACAVFAMSCFDVVTVDDAGASGDELTASACATDIADNTIGYAYCY